MRGVVSGVTGIDLNDALLPVAALQVVHVDYGLAHAVLVDIATRVDKKLVHTVAIDIARLDIKDGIVLLQVAGVQILKTASVHHIGVDRHRQARIKAARAPVAKRIEDQLNLSGVRLAVDRRGRAVTIGAKLGNAALFARGGIAAELNACGVNAREAVVVVGKYRRGLIVAQIRPGAATVVAMLVEVAVRIEIVDVLPELCGAPHTSIAIGEFAAAANVTALDVLELVAQSVAIAMATVSCHIDLAARGKRRGGISGIGANGIGRNVLARAQTQGLIILLGHIGDCGRVCRLGNLGRGREAGDARGDQRSKRRRPNKRDFRQPTDTGVWNVHEGPRFTRVEWTHFCK